MVMNLKGHTINFLSLDEFIENIKPSTFNELKRFWLYARSDDFVEDFGFPQPKLLELQRGEEKKSIDVWFVDIQGVYGMIDTKSLVDDIVVISFAGDESERSALCGVLSSLISE